MGFSTVSTSSCLSGVLQVHKQVYADIVARNPCFAAVISQVAFMSLPSGPLDGLLCAFSSSSGNFALATPDGRVRTYDTVSGRLRSTLSVGGVNASKGSAAANGHLAEGQQCITWVDSQETSAEARSSNPAGPSHSWLAVGTSAGAVKLYDSATGELRWTAANSNEGGVSCLAYSHAGRGVLLSSGPDGQAVSLDTHSGKRLSQFKGSKHGASAAALSADGSKLLLGGSTLTLWDLESQQRMSRLTGHPLPVRALCFSPDASHAISAAVGERLVAVWVVPQQGGKKKSGGVAAASLAVAQPVAQLATTAAGDSEPSGSFYAAATTEAGEVYVWLIRPKGDAAVDAQQVARLAVDPHHKQQEAIFAAALEHTAAGATLVVAVGSAAKPRFERVPMGTTAVKSSKITFLQPPPSTDDLIRPAAATAAATKAGAAGAADGSSGKAAAAAAAEVLGADNAGELVQQRQSKSSKKRSEPEPDGSEQQQQQGEDDALLANGIDGMDTDSEQELAGEPTLGQRVLELEHQQQQQPQQQEGGAVQAAAAEAGAGDAASGAAFSEGPVKADSLAVLLSQALRSSDRALLERCLSVGRDRVIVNSVKRLVPMDAALLLKAAVERLQTKPSRGHKLAAWIQAVLLHHTAYLMSAPAAAPLMSSLYQIIEARLAMQRQLLSLSGRLELLLAQRGPAAAEGQGAAGAAGAPVAQVVYQESDSEAEVEIVDAAGGASSDDGDDYTTDEGDDDDDDMSGDDLGSGDDSLSDDDADRDDDGMDEDSEPEDD